MYEILMDGKKLYYPGDEINVVTEAKITESLEDAGYMNITVPPANPLYGNILERKSNINVLKDSEIIWSGEVRNISLNIRREKKLYVVGDISFLNDSLQRPEKYTNLTPVQVLGELLNNHNSQVEERKRFQLGAVTIDVPENVLNVITDYESTLSVIREKICSEYKGYLKIRIRNGIKYVDVVKIEDYGTTCLQPIEFGENLLDYTEDLSTDEIATCVVPLGKVTKNEDGTNTYVTIASINEGKDYIYNQEAVNAFGWIKRTVNLNDVEDPEILLEEGQKWLSEYQFAKLTIKLNAIDLSILDTELDSFNLGDYVNTKAKPFGLDAWYYIRNKVTDLVFLEKNTVTIGNTISKGFTEQASTELKQMEKTIPISSILLDAAKQNSSELIKTATSGNIYLVMDENGKPRELLIMDTQDTKTAKKVWRWNINGFGFSSTGYNGIYGIAMTMDGAIVADFITAGTMSADRIRGGILLVGGSGLGKSGQIIVRTDTDEVVATLDSAGIDVRKGSIRGANITLGGTGNADGSMTILDASGNTVAMLDRNGVDVRKGSIKGADLTLGGAENINGTMKILDASGEVVASADRNGMNIYKGMFASYAENGSDRATVTDGSFKVWKGSNAEPLVYIGDGGWADIGKSGSAVMILHGTSGIVLDAHTGEISAQGDIAAVKKITAGAGMECNGTFQSRGRGIFSADVEVGGDIFFYGTSIESLLKRVSALESQMGGLT